MKRARSLQLLLITVLAPLSAPARADTNTLVVSGVAALRGGGRAADKNVGLYVSRDRAGDNKPVATDQTSAQGVFSLQKKNVAANVTELWLLCEDDEFIAEPILVQAPSVAGLRVVKAKDLLLYQKEQPSFTPTEARQVGRAIVETEAVKVRLGHGRQAGGKQDVMRDLKSIVAKTPTLGIDEHQLLQEILKAEPKESVLTPTIHKFRQDWKTSDKLSPDKAGKVLVPEREGPLIKTDRKFAPGTVLTPKVTIKRAK
jgi:hypothetical protein